MLIPELNITLKPNTVKKYSEYDIANAIYNVLFLGTSYRNIETHILDLGSKKINGNECMNTNDFKMFCLDKGFYYEDRFILSLETNPFLILTGISGSGKTKIAELWIEYKKSIYKDEKDRQYIIILDEMNLSHVERYFADFLSALESRSKEIKLPNGDIIRWNENLKIIGTVNVDETTYMFSPKVLDRANVIL